ncbi:MAG: archaeal proteasome endopeptidase complex subunit beta [Thermofilum sp.]|jgi:proteasome beta subunit|uniref:Proteasome subunit beta n=2 Tax=Thermofilum adornatum TaxID=1365176 RepID=S5Z6E3_9CREN|nr:archaeal proteasome endopeptidase complex subunit beta [Thermofilum adornatum]AGT34890.1 proteasome subunit beta [Thermofilum adornatum]AJB42619.1 Proteasome subunit beta, archaeal [Thermofilum adornatum 1505]NAZ25744.1 archaeal proteasome endopeptidase complex subunit beta [Thermofilum sp.]
MAIEKNFLKGTTTVGIVGKDFVVLAADRRATAGSYIANKQVWKIVEIDSHVAATIAGTVGDAQMLIDRLKVEAGYYKTTVGTPIPVKSLATLTSLILFNYRPILLVQMLIGGLDGDGPSLYSVDWLGTVTQEKYTATGSGSPYAVSMLEHEYREDMTLEEAVNLAVKAVNVALARDPGSGEGVDVATVTREGVKLIRR